MYIVKKDFVFPNNMTKKEIADKVGIAYETMVKILNRKQQCRKVVAYSIAKHINQNKEIENYFDIVED